MIMLEAVALEDCFPRFRNVVGGMGIWGFPCGLDLSSEMAYTAVDALWARDLETAHQHHHDEGHDTTYWTLLSARDERDGWLKITSSCSCKPLEAIRNG